MPPRKRKAPVAPVEAAKTVDVARPVPVRQPYQPIFREHPAAIDFLFGSRLSSALKYPTEPIAEEYKITPELALEEFRRLLAIKVLVVDHDDTKIFASPLMQAIWCAAILDTQFYAELQAALGCVLHHRPSTATETEREWRSGLMVSTYTSLFSTKPIETVPSHQSTSIPSTTSAAPDSNQSGAPSNLPATATPPRKHPRVVLDMTDSNDKTVPSQPNPSCAPRTSTIRRGGRTKTTVYPTTTGC